MIESSTITLGSQHWSLYSYEVIFYVHYLTIKSFYWTKSEARRGNIELVVVIFDVFRCRPKLTHY